MSTTGKLVNSIRPGACAKWSTSAFEGSVPFMDGHIIWNGAPLTEAEVEAKRAEWEASVVADKALSDWQTAMADTDATMTRQSEDIIGTMSETQFNKLPQYTQDAYAAKVTLRGEKP